MRSDDFDRGYIAGFFTAVLIGSVIAVDFLMSIVSHEYEEKVMLEKGVGARNENVEMQYMEMLRNNQHTNTVEEKMYFSYLQGFYGVKK